MGTYSAERIAAAAEGLRRKWQDPEYQQRQRRGHRGMRPGGVTAVGEYISAQGYRWITGLWDHPLANESGAVPVGRRALYDKIGPGFHECHWNYFSRCGQVALEWGGLDGIQVDHLDGDKLNDNPDNVVPSCLTCNRRGIRLVIARGGLYHNNTSGVTGVHWDKRTKRWAARPGGRWLGRFDSLEEAAAAIKAAKTDGD